MIAHPTAIAARVSFEGLTATGHLERVHVERWATDLLDVEVWAAAWPHPAAAGHEIRQFFTAPALAAVAACRRFTPAGNSAAPVTPDQLLRPIIQPTTTTIADGVCVVTTEHTHP